ncbi:OsmC family protein [Sansalvadorimonas sp. 2012CJ34-2]|uniref:OsmC family protein n=1 Tax=Parendozoicomonas callyspongiae TaxID=2942213 RepID=A0ABT0PDZ1_9GAMM|nr:OsmC family protein [Sansalvadorimonas sp. 2012CJ34-2]MCL6269577.1 OsmC family protein [Sansalvadorimonas sp. 2012CJ34-2]
MSVNKVVSVSAEMGKDFRIHAQLGNHLAFIDQPEAAGGTDKGPNPLQLFLFSLAGCIASIGRIAANQKKIELRGMKVNVEAGMNAAGLMGKPTEDRVGFQSFKVNAEIDADMTTEEKQAFLDEVCARCPVHDNIGKATVVEHIAQ